MAPDELSKAINKYTEHVSEVFNGEGKQPALNGYDVISLHNIYFNTKRPTCILFHSEPQLVDHKAPLEHKMVVAQYQATLPEFKGCTPMRNVIDWRQEMYDPIVIKDKIRIGFSPSRKDKWLDWHDKGYEETVTVLHRIQKRFPKVEVDVITDVPLEECIQRKNQCNIIIDECVTGSYHRSGLEGLALGKLTICYLSPPVKKVLMEAGNSKILPFHNTHINELETELEKIISLGKEYILYEGQIARFWMETHWRPEDIVNDFIEVYEQVK